MSLQQRRPRRLQARAQRRIGCGVADARQQGEPRLATAKDLDEQIEKTAHPVVEMGEYEPDRPSMRGLAVRQMRDQTRRCKAIQVVGVLFHAEPVAQAGQHRQAARQSQIQCVDRLDPQPARIREQPPAVPLIRGERGACQPACAVVVVAVQAGMRFRIAQGVENPGAHFRGCLARERDRQQRFGRIERREQRQAALNRGAPSYRSRRAPGR